MRANSLALRLFLTAAIWTGAILVLTGIVLSTLYREGVERAFDRRLGVYLKTLVADVSTPQEDGTDKPAERAAGLSEPLFELPLSGWYWCVTRLDKSELRASRSLWGGQLPRLAEPAPADPPGVLREGYVQGPDDQRLRVVERTIDLGEEGRYLIAVAGDAAEIDEELRAFEWALLATLGVLAVVLLMTTVFQVRFGLAPLKRISERLAAIRFGAGERLEGTFPVEIDPLAREMNALIDANRELVERARTHVGNLAHALKTPLSVIFNEATGRDDPFGDKVREQAAIMRDQITRHLERARLAARLTTVGTVTEVAPVVGSLARTMEKIHRDRAIEIAFDAPEDVRFHGERQDLEEMVGNLVDNACKWARAQVRIAVVPPADNAMPGQKHVTLLVDDDGPGLSPEQREQVAHRGQRLDESKPGSGLGLSIVVELAALYGGRLQLEEAPIGGLRAQLVLPAA